MDSSSNPATGSDRTRPARRKRRTRRSAVVGERCARFLISTGGILTIVAVGGILVFLTWVAAPLLGGAELGPAEPVAEASTTARPLDAGLDEYGRLFWTLFEDGGLELRRTDDGELLERRALAEGTITASSLDPHDGSLSLGFADGTVRLGTVHLGSRFLSEDQEPAELAGLRQGEVHPWEGGVVERLESGQLRAIQLRIDLEEPISLGDVAAGGAAPSPIVRIDHAILPNGPVVSALDAAGDLEILGVRKTTNLLTGEDTLQVTSGRAPYAPDPARPAPSFLALFGGGDGIVLAWEDGYAIRYDTRAFSAIAEAETLDLVPEEGATLTALGALIGKRTLVVGTSEGRVSGWFRIKPDGSDSPDGARLVRAHAMQSEPAAVTALAPSPSSRTFAVGHADGGVRLYFMTSEKPLAHARVPSGDAVVSLTLAPRGDLLIARTGAGLTRWTVDSPHPEASLQALFGETWYEGYPEPDNVWQSSSGTDDFEAKLGLLPLVFGTIKATVFSMLFGVPLALLAALYSSEFLDPRIRVGVKSVVEIMASLPSVVLGFLAAIVIAPFVQSVLPATLTSFFTIPTCMLVGAYLWQLVPQRIALRFGGWKRFGLIWTTIPIGILAAVALGPWIELWLFHGDVEAWLDGQAGGAAVGWMFLLLPLCALLVAFLSGRLVTPLVRRASLGWSRGRSARFDLLRFAGTGLLVVALAVAAGFGLDAAGADPRGGIVDTYVQRNALVVGFIMGFAIIPIIYTLAEDALSSVPEHLRLASLGAGATPWQTAVRIIIPTAASGLFSAVMIGLGRAVGETMIVLMAAGNTPVTEWNVFSGFRTLSANIAVELPEAVKNDTHYRTLFLAALTLFAMTFVVNTAAELVRQRFRKRAFQL